MRNQESGAPQLVAVSSAVGFGSLNLTIHSYSADWLYQALLFIFSGTIKRQIEEAVDSAVHTVRDGLVGGGRSCAVGLLQRLEADSSKQQQSRQQQAADSSKQQAAGNSIIGVRSS